MKIQVEMTDEDIITRIKETFGGRVWESNYPSKYKAHPKAKLSWRWAVGKQQELQYIIEKVYPYLGTRRRAKCDEILSYINKE